MKFTNYCFKRGEIWCFRKKIKAGKLYGKKKPYIYKVSLKRIMGPLSYHRALLSNSIISISFYLNSCLEVYLHTKRNFTLVEINEFIISVLKKYESEAFMHDNNYIENINSRRSEIEDLRFNNLSFIDDDGKKCAGHTPKALTKEINELKEAYDSQNSIQIRKKTHQILNRQDIITKDELDRIENLDNDLRKFFEEGLIKKEIEILLRDKKNYIEKFGEEEKNSACMYSELTPETLNLLALAYGKEHPFTEFFENKYEKEKQSNKVISNDTSDDWETLIEMYLLTLKASSIRNEKVTLQQFSQMVLGDYNYEYPKKELLNCDYLDIKKIQELFAKLPRLNSKKFSNWKSIGIISVISNMDKNELQVSLKGKNERLKTICKFLKFIKDTEPKYKDLNITLWESYLKVSKNDLTSEAKIQNKNEVKQAFKSEYINYFLSNRYKIDTTKRKANEKRIFTSHTTSSPHIFWSVMLGIFTGARASELAQLNISDIKRDNDIYYFDITDDDVLNQSTKNDSSKRKAPICQKLLDLGFLNYVSKRQSQNKSTLFDLKMNKDGKRPDFQKSFNDEIKVSIKELDDSLPNYKFSYHGLREHFVTKFLESGDLDSESKLIQLKKLIGHTAHDLHKDVTIDHYYRSKMEIKKGKDLIDSVDFQINEGYETVRKLMIDKFGEPIYDLVLP